MRAGGDNLPSSGSPADAERFVAVAAFSQPFEAHLARGCLETHGIECVLSDEHLVSINWLYSRAVGGVKCKVREADRPRALALLATAGPRRSTSADWISADLDAPRCPHCGSLRLDTTRFSQRWAIASWLILGVPLPLLRRRAACRSCGARFRPERAARGGSRRRRLGHV